MKTEVLAIRVPPEVKVALGLDGTPPNTKAAQVVAGIYGWSVAIDPQTNKRVWVKTGG